MTSSRKTHEYSKTKALFTMHKIPHKVVDQHFMLIVLRGVPQRKQF